MYHVEAGSRDPIGGVPRFKTLCTYYQSSSDFDGQPEAITLFSGDAWNPSLESSVTKGKHMVPVLNDLGTDVACLGNHDLDFGVEQFEYLAKLCTFPWLCSNVLDADLGEDVALGHCKRSVMLTSSNSIKIGIVGLVEREWLDTINSLPPNIRFLEPRDVAKECAAKLRADGAEMIIALTHQRQPNDEKLAEDLEPGTVDIILSGHDHYYAHSVTNGIHVLRSGTDFRQLSYIEARREQTHDDTKSQWNFHIIRRDVVSSIQPDSKAAEMVEKITEGLRPKLEKPIGYTAVPLDARFTTVRTQESNMGNFVCDLMRFHYDADCCIAAAGTWRGDQVYPPGVLRLKDILDCFPFEDPCVVVGVTGKAIVEALENAVSKYPALEGRFPQVSGIQFCFDPSKPPMQRCSEVMIGGKPAVSGKAYKLVTRDYMVRGKDGFTSLMLEEDGGTARSIVGNETGMLLSVLLRQYFMSLKVLGRWKCWGAHLGRHWRGVHDNLHRVHPVRKPVELGVMLSQDSSARLGPKPNTPDTVGEAPRKSAQSQTGTHDGLLMPSDSEDDESHRADLPAVPVGPDAQQAVAQRERELVIMRKFMRRWWRIIGLPGHPTLADDHGDDRGVHWTKAIAPKVEGRIRMVQ